MHEHRRFGWRTALLGTWHGLVRLAATPRGRLWIVAAAVLLVALLVGGRALERHLGALEASLPELGTRGILLLACGYVIAVCLLLPDTLFRLAAGALFGFLPGVLGVALCTLLASLLQFALARPLRPRIERAIEHRSTLAALRRAVLQNGLRLQLLIRLTPVNHATVSYVFAAAGVRLREFLMALPAMLPSILLEVWAGHAGRDAARLAGSASSGSGDVLTFVGLALGVVAMIVVSRVAHAAVTRAMEEAETSKIDRDR